ncbi:MAG TPA: flagellar protein FlgN [Gammaproteobacteria bacterium]|nr:flagellar protein FlgN [Gammaproteobacteria bacterium]
MSNPTSAQRLLALLEEQQQDAARMLEILQAEFNALKGNDLQAFEQVMDIKLKHLNDLEQKERSSLPALEKIIGSPCNRQQLEAFIVNRRDAQLLAGWQSLHTTLKQCHEQNLLNQRVLAASHAQVQQALNLLRGEDPQAPPSVTYQDSGKPDQRHAPGQSIAIA